MAIVRDIMPAFELFQPATIQDALTLLDRHSSDAWVLAGGLDSFDWLKDRIKRPKAVIDLSQIRDLSGVRETNGGLEIGAATNGFEPDRAVHRPCVQVREAEPLRDRAGDARLPRPGGTVDGDDHGRRG